MGGSVNVAMRFKDGRAVCQERWTNNTSYWLKRPALYESEAGALEYLALVADNDHVVDPHAPGLLQPLRNDEYGLIVIDYVTMTILENNGYTSLSSFDAVHTGGDDPSEAFLECAAAGRLRMRRRTFNMRGGLSTKVAEDIGDPLKHDEAIRAGRLAHDEIFRERTKGGDRIRTDFIIDPSPFTVERLPERDTKRMRQRLREIGFPMKRADGLNARERPNQKSRELTDQQKTARKLLQSWKKTEGAGVELVGTRYEELPSHLQDRLMDAASRYLCDRGQADAIIRSLG